MHESYDYEMNILIKKHERSTQWNLDMHTNKHMNCENTKRKELINWELTCMNLLYENRLLYKSKRMNI